MSERAFINQREINRMACANLTFYYQISNQARPLTVHEMYQSNILRSASTVFRQIQSTRQSIQNPLILPLPGATFSSSSWQGKTDRKHLLRGQTHPTHHIQQRFYHEDPERTISTVERIAIKHISAGFLKMISNLVKYVYIQTFLDRSFKVGSFVDGAKAAICFVSSALAEGNTDSLQDAVTSDTLSSAIEGVKELHEDKRHLLVIKTEDIFHFGILDIGIIEDQEKRYAEITTVACAKDRKHRVIPESLKGLEKSGLEQMNMFQLLELIRSQDSVLLVTCRFIREFTKGVTDGWTVNKIHHTFVIPQK